MFYNPSFVLFFLSNQNSKFASKLSCVIFILWEKKEVNDKFKLYFITLLSTWHNNDWHKYYPATEIIITYSNHIMLNHSYRLWSDNVYILSSYIKIRLLKAYFITKCVTVWYRVFTENNYWLSTLLFTESQWGFETKGHIRSGLELSAIYLLLITIKT